MSDEPKKRRLLHPTVRLILWILVGGSIGWIFAPGAGNTLDFWIYAAPYPQIAEGAAAGLFVELATRIYLRILDPLRPTHLNR